MKPSIQHLLALATVSLCALVHGQAEEPVAGGLNSIDVNNAFLVDAITAVQPQMHNQLNSPFLHRMGKVTQAYSQVVAGLKFYVTLEMIETSCRKAELTSSSNLDSCSATKTKTCQAEIWVQSWLNHNELLFFSCIEPTTAPPASS